MRQSKLVRVSGLTTLASMAMFLMVLTVIAVGVAREGVEFSDIAPPLTPHSLSAFFKLRAYFWPAAWLALVSIFLMALTPIGLSHALHRSAALTQAATVLFYAGLAAGLVHVSFQSLVQTAIASRYAAAPPSVKEAYYALGAVFYDVNDFFEKAWGIARAASVVLYTLSTLRVAVFPGWAIWVGVVGSVELVYRMPTIALNRPSGGVQDLFFTVWLIGLGVAMLHFQDPDELAGNDHEAAGTQ